MAQFGINSHTPIAEICLDSTAKPDGGQKRITLVYSSRESATAPDLGSVNERLMRIVDKKFDAHHRVTTFTIEAVKDAAGTAYLWDKAATKDAMLRVVVGPVKNHNSFRADLLAELLGRSEVPSKLRTYQQILSPKNNDLTGGIEKEDAVKWDTSLKDQPLKQITLRSRAAEWNCGGALESFGKNNFGRDHFASFGNTRYYKPFHPKPKTQNKQSDIQFDAEKLKRGVEKMRSLLDQKKSVTIFASHADGFSVSNGVIQPRSTTHYLTVIGCNVAGTTFLVTDPWPGGSRLMYNSGIFGTVDSAFLGVLEYNESQNLMSTPPGQRGKHNYTVLTGP